MPLRSVEAATREDAIAAAREQFGPSVRVIGVRRVRSGGVLGFFATERYVAEVDPEPVARRSLGSAPAPTRDRAGAGAGRQGSIAERAAELAAYLQESEQRVDEIAELFSGSGAETPAPTYSRTASPWTPGRPAAQDSHAQGTTSSPSPASASVFGPAAAAPASPAPAARAAVSLAASLQAAASPAPHTFPSARSFPQAAPAPEPEPAAGEYPRASFAQAVRKVTEASSPITPSPMLREQPTAEAPSPSPFTAALARMVAVDHEVRQAVQDALDGQLAGAASTWNASAGHVDPSQRSTGAVHLPTGAPHQEEKPVTELETTSGAASPGQALPTWAAQPTAATSSREDAIAQILRSALAQNHSDEVLADILRKVLADTSTEPALPIEALPIEALPIEALPIDAVPIEPVTAPEAAVPAPAAEPSPEQVWSRPAVEPLWAPAPATAWSAEAAVPVQPTAPVNAEAPAVGIAEIAPPVAPLAPAPPVLPPVETFAPTETTGQLDEIAADEPIWAGVVHAEPAPAPAPVTEAAPAAAMGAASLASLAEAIRAQIIGADSTSVPSAAPAEAPAEPAAPATEVPAAPRQAAATASPEPIEVIEVAAPEPAVSLQPAVAQIAVPPAPAAVVEPFTVGVAEPVPAVEPSLAEVPAAAAPPFETPAEAPAEAVDAATVEASVAQAESATAVEPSVEEPVEAVAPVSGEAKQADVVEDTAAAEEATVVDEPAVAESAVSEAARFSMPELARTASDPAPLPADATTIMPALSLLPPLPGARQRGGRPPVPPPSRPAVPPSRPAAEPRDEETADPAEPLATVTRLHVAPLADPEPEAPVGAAIESAAPDVDTTDVESTDVETTDMGAADLEIADLGIGEIETVDRFEPPADARDEPAGEPTPAEEPAAELPRFAVATHEPAGEPSERVVGRAADVVDRLRTLGMPRHVLGADFAADAETRGTYAALTAALSRQLPEAPTLPTGAGEVLFVVGPGVATLRAARALAASVGLHPDAVQWASRGELAGLAPKNCRMSTVDVAIERRQEAIGSGTVTIVAVDAPLRSDAYWMGQMLTVWTPVAVWAVVEATRKPEDLGPWLDELPRFDALVLQDTDLSADPAAVLGRVSKPVALLDGVRATPHRWASLLCERLESIRA